MTTPEPTPPLEVTDAELVANSLGGDRNAFGQIVTRYQALVCSLAYSATGSLTQSEDLAQETFVTAWKQLPGLREPQKLRSWLCGIVRNSSQRAWRGRRREPMHQAEPLEKVEGLPARESHPLQQAISQEEEAILWRQLEGIPELYREPLILFYRQHESVRQVALALDLSEETVRQRLVRGRKLLHERVLQFVEGALGKTAPDAAFTPSVLAALPTAAASAKAAAAGATAATGGAAAKGFSVLFGTTGALFAMIGGTFVTARGFADDTKSLRERKLVYPLVAIPLIVLVVLSLGLGLVWRRQFFHSVLVRDSVFSAAFFLFLFLGLMSARYRFLRQRQIQMEERTYDDAEWTLPRKETDQRPASAGNKPGTRASGFKRFALPFIACVVSAFYAPWKQHLVLAIITAAVWPFIFASLFFRSERNRPRYAAGPPSIVIGIVIFAGVCTLLVANADFHVARVGLDRAKIVAPVETIFFNLAVIFAYGALAGRLIWVRRRLEWLRQRGLPLPGGERIGFFRF